MSAASILGGRASREVVLGTRGGLHIAHPLAEKTLCGVGIGERSGIDAFRYDPAAIYNDACQTCTRMTFSGGNEERLSGAYA